MPESGNMPVSDAQEPAEFLHLALPQSQKVVLVMDVVESVRLMATDEAGTLARWLGFVRHAEQQVLPAYQGRLVKSLGDGFLVEFEQPRQAVNAALALHSALTGINTERPAPLQLRLRAGIHSTLVYTDRNDIYGAGVNLAARLATLALPGETVVSSSVRDALTDGLDASLEDMGECYLKNLAEPVRAYRARRVGILPATPSEPTPLGQPLHPTIAVIPFESRSLVAEHFSVGEMIADGVIAQLSRAPELRVISRLSTTRFRGRDAAGQDIKTHLAAHFALTGSYFLIDDRLVVSAELVDLRDDQLVWADRLIGSLTDLLATECELSHQLALAVQQAVLNTERERVRQHTLPTLASYSLMLAGVSLMHQSTTADFERSRSALDHLLERHTSASSARAWLAKWHILKTTRGLSQDVALEGRLALAQTQRALDTEPDNSFALAMEGFVYCHLKRDMATASDRLALARSINPNESLAWLFQSVVFSFTGDAISGLEASERALALSPLDPLRYYYESLASSSALAAQHFERAAELCASSLRLNRTHLPTMRAYIAALVALGREPEARAIALELLRLAPGFNVKNYLARSADSSSAFTKRIAEAMRLAGVPYE